MSRVLLARHAHAGERGSSTGDDRLRPLSGRGRAQAQGLVAALAGYRVTRLLSSGFARCVQTLEPLASARDLIVETVDWLAEGADPKAALRTLIAAGDVAACSHGDVISGILFDLADQAVPLGSNPRMQKGSTWVLDVDGGAVVAARYLPPPEYQDPS